MNLDELKQTPIQKLPEVATAIRKRILEVMSENGGHLASNLGSVELTLALHYVFNSPDDRFIFDVSHQAYTHKLLTERDDERFNAIRKPGGLSGFSHPGESEHDHFFAGHAGTALSLGLGMAQSRDQGDSREHVIPIIGDATLTCGLALEAMNNIPSDLSNFIIILNDNAMSISHNVGGITTILSRLISHPRIGKVSRQFEHLLQKLPLYGETLVKQKRAVTEAIKGLFGVAPFFEHFGLDYTGPVDGHDVCKLVSLFESIKNSENPVIVHLQTQKGHGLRSAEEDPVTFHGVKPFDLTTCKFHPTPVKGPTFPKVIGKHLIEMGEEHSNLLLTTPAMSLGSCLDPFFDTFPTRSFDVGIAEGHAVTFSAGLAKTGESIVICSIYATFLQRALDNVFHDVCLQEIPVIFAVDRAGLATGDGATHHGIYDISFLSAMPNMVICQPRDGEMAVNLLDSAPVWKQPTAIRYPNVATTKVNNPPSFQALGKGEILCRGDDILIIPLGTMVERAKEVREALIAHQIEATIFDPIFVKPFDYETLSELLVTHDKVVTIEEHAVSSGMGSVVTNFIVSHGFDHVNVLNLGIPDHFFEHGTLKTLHEQVGLLPEQIVKRIQFHFQLHHPQKVVKTTL